jgi:hypothetical protein
MPSLCLGSKSSSVSFGRILPPPQSPIELRLLTFECSELAVCKGAVYKRVPSLLEDREQAPEQSSEMELDGDE